MNLLQFAALPSITFNWFTDWDNKVVVPYILESNLHPFYGCRGLKSQMRIRIECGLDS
jgi:hypothetical protein